MSQNRSRLTMLAGWLFADLFLVLLVAGLAALPAKTSAKPAKPPSSLQPTPTQSPTAVHRLGLDPHYLAFSISLSPISFRGGGKGQLVADVESQLARLDPAHRLIGFVLVFASDDPNDAGRAVRTATDAFNLLHSRSPYFAVATGLGYWNGVKNDFEFKVFLLN